MSYQREKTYSELAQDALMNNEPESFLESLLPSTNENLNVIIFYFQALGSLMGKLYSSRHEESQNKYSNENLDLFNKNKATLEAVRLEIEDFDLDILLLKYNEAIIMSGIVYSVRMIEATIKNYDIYLSLKEKFLNWPKIGIKSDRLAFAWKDFNISLLELEQWLLDKKHYYMPAVEAVIREFETNKDLNSKICFSIMKKYIKEEKEIFYAIANILISNPLLHREILILSQLDQVGIFKFEKIIFGMIEVIKLDNQNEMLSNMLRLFTKQIKFDRPDLIIN